MKPRPPDLQAFYRALASERGKRGPWLWWRPLVDTADRQVKIWLSSAAD